MSTNFRKQQLEHAMTHDLRNQVMRGQTHPHAQAQFAKGGEQMAALRPAVDKKPRGMERVAFHEVYGVAAKAAPAARPAAGYGVSAKGGGFVVSFEEEFGEGGDPCKAGGGCAANEGLRRHSVHTPVGATTSRERARQLEVAHAPDPRFIDSRKRYFLGVAASHAPTGDNSDHQAPPRDRRALIAQSVFAFKQVGEVDLVVNKSTAKMCFIQRWQLRDVVIGAGGLDFQKKFARSVLPLGWRPGATANWELLHKNSQEVAESIGLAFRAPPSPHGIVRHVAGEPGTDLVHLAEPWPGEIESGISWVDYGAGIAITLDANRALSDLPGAVVWAAGSGFLPMGAANILREAEKPFAVASPVFSTPWASGSGVTVELVAGGVDVTDEYVAAFAGTGVPMQVFGFPFDPADLAFDMSAQSPVLRVYRFGVRPAEIKVKAPGVNGFAWIDDGYVETNCIFTVRPAS